jgi:hypothetical protein
MRRSSTVVALALTAVALSASSGAAQPAAVDLGLRVQLGRAGGAIQDTTTGPNFQIVLTVDSGAPVEQTVTIRIGLPDGLRWGSDAPDPTEGCTGVAPAVCTQRLTTNPVGTFGGGYFWDVVAERLGTYEITASVEGEQPDPDRSNNTATFRFEVVAAGGGGGGSGGGGSGGGGSGGGGSGGGSAAAKASAVKLSPAKPKAGSTVVASVRVTKGGAPLRPRAVGCSASIGRTKLKAAGRSGSGVASCLFRTPRAARGKTLRGSVRFTAGGTAFARAFSVKLA